MKLVRGIERRLEQLVEGVAVRVFRGSLHPIEIAARLVREADLTAIDTPDGPLIPNAYALRLNPDDIVKITQPERLNRELEAAIDETARERGWRMVGPTQVWMEASDTISAGRLTVTAEVRPGVRKPWARLRSADGVYELSLNRSTIGRGEECDIKVPVASVSRRHCLVWQESGSIWAADLGSSNGTFVNGVNVSQPVALFHGDRLVLGGTPFTFEVI